MRLRSGLVPWTRSGLLRGSPPLAWALLLVCVAAAASAAVVIRNDARESGRRTFDADASRTAYSVGTSLRQADDLAISFASTVATSRGSLNNAGLARWYRSITAGGRDPAVLGVTYIRHVTAAQLPAFAGVLRADPTPGQDKGPLRVVPGGRRPDYCLPRLLYAPTLAKNALLALGPRGATIDFCGAPGRGFLAAARDAGHLSAVVLTTPPLARVLNITIPIYRGLEAPASVARRRATLDGWALAQFSLDRVIGGAVAAQHRLGLRVTRRDLTGGGATATAFGPVSTVASVGARPAGGDRSDTFSVNADGRWLITVVGRLRWAGIAPDPLGLIVFGTGVIIGLLVFTTVTLSARSGAKSERLLHAIFKRSPAGLFIRDRQFRYISRNDAFDALMGIDHDSDGVTAEDVLPAEAMEQVLANEQRVLAGETVSEEITVMTNGSVRTLSVIKFPLLDSSGHAYAVCGIATDLTGQRRLEKELRFLSDHDPLTGLYNRRRLIAELARQLSYAGRYNHAGAVLTFDIDDLTIVNDSLGNEAGDTLLKALADLLEHRTRDTDIVARLGADQFCVVLPEATADDALALAEDIRARLRRRRLGPPMTVSVGIATFTGGGEVTADQLLVAADTALFEARERGADQIKVHRAGSGGTLTWVQRIRAALADGRLVLYGQPIVDRRTGEVARHELLIRMLSEDGDIIPPAAFLPTAERFGLINEIDRWVTRTGLRLAIEGRAVTINLSASSIGDQSIIEAVRAAVTDGLDPSKVLFEITETAAMTNVNAARQFAATLNAIGCSLALDDFGTGFGSFTYLRHIPVQYLKIDLEFVRELTRVEADRQIVKQIIQIAHSLGKLTIAEGVEDAETLRILERFGADYVQGFHLGRPEQLFPPAPAEKRSARNGAPRRPRAARSRQSRP